MWPGDGWSGSARIAGGTRGFDLPLLEMTPTGGLEGGWIDEWREVGMDGWVDGGREGGMDE